MNETTLPSGLRIRNFSPAVAVRGRARYISEAPHNIESSRVSGSETVYIFVTRRPVWGSNPVFPTFHAGSFNHSPRPSMETKNTSFNAMWRIYSSLKCTIISSLPLLLIKASILKFSIRITSLEINVLLCYKEILKYYL